MQALSNAHLIRLPAMAAMLVLLLRAAPGQAESYQGLWVGQVTLTRVNEVSIPLDQDNQPRAPKPEVATPTADAANLRLILHVNGSGQVNLLKDVAILNRVSGDGATNIVNLVGNSAILNAQGDLLRSESDYSLVTDERLFQDFPAQAAVRIASAVFDFGDSITTEAVDEVVDAAANLAGASVYNSTANFKTSAGRVAAENAARDAALNASTEGNAQSVVDNADVASDFSQFLIDHFKSSDVNAIADAADPNAAAGTLTDPATPRGAAEALRVQSFYDDTRALEMIDAVVAAVLAQTNGTSVVKRQAAHNTAASFADTTDNYQRFIAGKQFGDMIFSAAESAAAAAVKSGASSSSIRTAVDAHPDVAAIKTEALRIRISQYDDTRATTAVNQVLDAIVAQASALIPATASAENSINESSRRAGQDALATTVARYPIAARAPTGDYTDFIQSETFQQSAVTAAAAAAAGAVSERANNALYTEQSIKDAAKVAAVTALSAAYGAAARAVRNELPLDGTFAPGEGDTRLTWEINQENGPPLGPAALTGTIYLPANLPTNPFRHRIHPDHTRGFDIKRNLRLDFDANDAPNLPRAGFGVSRITGVYREEILGLHKPLGPNPSTAPIGLKVEGTFELNRISLIDTLNAR